MRERLDCALFETHCTMTLSEGLSGMHANGRLHIQPVGPPQDVAVAESSLYVASLGHTLRRFDVCLIPVAESNLAWVRMTLAAARGALGTPVLAVVYNVRAAALYDLLMLGMADFHPGPVCFDSLRVRIEHILDKGRYAVLQQASVHAPTKGVGETNRGYGAEKGCQHAAAQGSIEQGLLDNILDCDGSEIEAYAAASASRCATTRESFRAAKGKVIERFERAYITAALGRHSGNIAMAARAAQKHRRAFWALMRKHHIDATPYRGLPGGKDLPGG